MDQPSHQVVRARELTDEAFAPFGDIIKPRRGGQQFDRTHMYQPEREETHVRLVLTNGEPVLRIMHLTNRGLVFTKLARHRRVSQCLGALEGKDWYVGVAAPDAFADVTNPQLDAITAFRIPGDRIIKLHVGTWHAGPHFTHPECLFVNLENAETNTKDFQDIPLPQACRIEP